MGTHLPTCTSRVHFNFLNMCSLLSGIFERVYTQDDCDFYATWFGKEMMQAMLGCKITFKSLVMCPKKTAAHWLIEGHPEFNCFAIFTEGIENCVDIPHMGGQCKITFKKNAAGDGFDSVNETAKMGKWEMSEKYTEQGLEIVVKHDGKCHKECYKRVIHENGFYRVHKTTGVKEFMDKMGMPEALTAAMVDDYKFCWESCPEGFKMTEWFGDLKVKFAGKFNEEMDYQFPMEGVPASKFVATRTGLGKYNTVTKDANGCTTEWTFHFCGKGAKVCARNVKTGDTCTFEMAKETPLFGKWKPVTIDGCKELLCAVGTPACEAEKIANDFDCRLCIEKKGPIVRWQLCSKVQPFDFCFKFDKEVEIFNPHLKENTKNIATKDGNCVTVVTKSSHGTWITKCTFGCQFMVQKVHLQGLECMPITMIFQREGC